MGPDEKTRRKIDNLDKGLYKKMLNNEFELRDELNKGHSAAWEMEWKLAESHYRKAYSIASDDVNVINSLALSLFNQEKLRESLKYYLESIKLNDPSPAPYEKSAVIFEKLNNLEFSANQYMQTAEIFLKQRDIKKALEHWQNVIRLNPSHINAHKRLAIVYHKTQKYQNAFNEYLNLVVIYQNEGSINEAKKNLEKAATINSNSPEFKEAERNLNDGTMMQLPENIIYPEKLNTKPLEEETQPLNFIAMPVEEAKKIATEELAIVLFELSDSDEIKSEKLERDLVTAVLVSPGIDRDKVIFHLSQAVNSMANNVELQVEDELLAALNLGFTCPASFFLIGYIYFKNKEYLKFESYLRKALIDEKYELASRLLIAKHQFDSGKIKNAVEEYLLALRKVDSEVVERKYADSLYKLYDPLIESMKKSRNKQEQKTLCSNIEQLLNSAEYKKAVKDIRNQLIGEVEDNIIPVASILTEEKSSEIVEIIARINELMSVGQYRTAIEEIYLAMTKTAAYLPLHILIADVLTQLNQNNEAAIKYEIIARTYIARGESRRARVMFEKIITLVPMNIEARLQLVKLLEESGENKDALAEYMRISDIYYRLSNLDQARLTCEQAYHLARKSEVDNEWLVKILTRTADLDLQRLDWPNAIKIYEMIYMMQPGNEDATAQLIELNIGISQEDAAISIMNDYLNQQFKNNYGNRAMSFLESFVKKHPEFLFIRKRLGEIYQQANVEEKAIEQWEKAALFAQKAGNPQEAKSFYQLIISLEPENIEEYRGKLLAI